MGLWVLGIVARPLVWWKILLLVGCVVGYVLLFTVPFLRELVLLEPGNTQLMCLGLVVGAVGALVIEVVHRVVKGRRIRK